MCGIAGIYKFSRTPCSEQEITNFAKPISHRGPDSEGFKFYVDGRLALAHKRLSILDLSEKASQPMQSANGKLSIIFNGEIFNFIELRVELQEKGHSFYTETDTEVILSAYEEWGLECFNRFNGMWAMALFNHENNEVLLSRDRFGIKPLFYSHIGDVFAFASETNCFKNLEGYHRSFNHSVLNQALHNPYYANSINSSIFNGIEQLPAGCVMRIDTHGLSTTERYYSFEASCAEQSDQPYNEGEFRELFIDSVRLRLRSDVPIATAFSGGLDSTAVYSTIKHLANNPESISRLPSKWQTPFCMAMQEDDRVNDLPFAKAALSDLNSEGVFLETNHQKLMDNLVADHNFYDDIIGTPLTTISPIYEAMKSNGFTVSMDGHGADEYLYGYRNMVMDLFYKATQYKGKKYSKRVLSALIAMYHPEDQNKTLFKLGRYLSKQYNLSGYFKRLLRNTVQSNEPESQIVLDNLFHSPLPTLLKTFDKAAMKHGVEIRMPFMDYRLIEKCYNLPNHYKINQGQTKWILRNELKDILPKSTLERNYKIGVQAPIDSWLNGKHQEAVQSLINDGPHKQLIKEINSIDMTPWAKFNLQCIDL